MPPQFRPATRTAIAALVAILALGGALRLWGVDAGAPARMGVDEPVVLETTLRILKTGDFNPHFFDYGGLTFYMHTAVSAVAFVRSAGSGRGKTLDALWIGDILVPTRTFTALLGALTILLVFRIGLRWGEPVALVAALTFAVLPAHVRESHFTLTDTPLTLGVALTMLLAMRAAERRTLGAMALAGVGVGLTAAIKYNGAVASVMPAIAALAFPAGQRLKALLAAAAASAGTFVLAAPYTILDLPHFLNAFAALTSYYSAQRRSTGEAAWIYLAHARNWFSWAGIVPLQFGYLALLVAAAGALRLLAATATDTWRWSGGIVVGFFLVYFWFVSNQGSLLYGRYLLPAAPALAVALSAGATGLSTLLAARFPRAGHAVLPAVLVVLLGLPVTSSVNWNRQNARPSTMDQVGRWLTSRVTETEPVVMEGSAVQVHPRVRLKRVGQIVEKSIDDYRAERVTYLVTSSEITDAYAADPANRATQAAALRDILARAEVVQTFEPNPTRTGPTYKILRVPQ